MTVNEAIRYFFDTYDKDSICFQDFLLLVEYIYFIKTGKEIAQKKIREEFYKMLDLKEVALSDNDFVSIGINYVHEDGQV